MSIRTLAIGAFVIILLGIAYYAVSPLWNNIKLDEAAPGSGTTADTASSEAVPVTPTLAHPAEGTARVVIAEGKRYIRYENYKTINGPDLYVYLSRDLEATDFVNLGPIKATEGNVNYEIPAEINLDDYPYVLTWCKAFSVLFNSAKLN